MKLPTQNCKNAHPKITFFLFRMSETEQTEQQNVIEDIEDNNQVESESEDDGETVTMSIIEVPEPEVDLQSR